MEDGIDQNDCRTIVFAFVIGLLMHMIFRKEDEKRLADERLFKDMGEALMHVPFPRWLSTWFP